MSDGDAGFIGFASRLNPLTLEPGMLQDSVNMRLDRGVAQTRKGAKRLADDVDTAAVPPLSLPFTLGTDKSVTSITFVTNTATATVTAHGYTTNDVVNIRGATGADASKYNGDFTITVTGADTFTYTMSGTPSGNATGTIIANDGPVIQSNYAAGIYAMGVFSSPRVDNSKEYIVLAGGPKAYFWRDGGKPFSKSYPSSPDEVIEPGDECSVLQAFDRVYVFRKAPEFGVAKTATITSASTTATVTCFGHGFQTGQTVRIQGAEPSGYNGNYTVTYVDANTFTYTLANSLTSPATGSITAEGATGYGPKNITSGGITVSGTTATVNCTAHAYTAGMTVRLEGSTTAAFDGVEYEVATVSTNSFTITVPTGTVQDTTITGRTVARVKPPLYWDGDAATNFVRAARGVPAEGASFQRMQSVGWASYINNRVWLPDGRDAVMISDVLDPDLFDPFFSSFRANEGSADYIVGIHPWVDGQALVFMRNSIWLATLNEFSSTDGSDFSVDTPVSRLTLLTDEVGCVARKSIQTAGQYVYFLSDAGVYRLDSRLDLKLRGDTRPLSDSIADKLDGLTGEQASLAIGRWFNNRYWLSVPQNVQAGVWNLYIYSALNEQWETKDIYDFVINDLLVSIYNGERRLFACSNNGRLFLLEELETGDMSEAGSVVTPISASIRSRRYSMNQLRSKRFLRFVADAVLPHQAAIRMKAATINPDTEDVVLNLANSSGEDEDYSLKGAIRKKANYLDVIFESVSGRPNLRALTIEAALNSEPATIARTRE